MRTIVVILAALLLPVVASVSCDAPTFSCVDDLVVGDGEWTCYCKADGLPCESVGECMRECSP